MDDVVYRRAKAWNNALTAVGALMTLIDFTLSNDRQFYSSMGNPLAVCETPAQGFTWTVYSFAYIKTGIITSY